MHRALLRLRVRLVAPLPLPCSSLSSNLSRTMSTKKHAADAAGVLVEHDHVDGQRTGVVLVTLNRPDKVRARAPALAPAVG